MIRIRNSEDRGHANHGWLDTHHTFSFANYHDPEHMGFRALRVINEDFVDADAGFPTHPHRDFEIISYVVDGALSHRDSMGNTSMIVPGEIQRMTAGTGVTHSEWNSGGETVHLLQIWLQPERRGLEPSYEQKSFPPEQRRGALALVGSRDGRDGSVTIHQDVDLYAAQLGTGDRVSHALANGRHAWVQVVTGDVELNGQRLGDGDGAAVSDEAAIELRAAGETELLLFDLA
jgi:hypothetical protein